MGGGPENQLDLRCAAACCYPSWISLVKVPRWPSIIARVLGWLPIFASLHEPELQLFSIKHLHLLLAPQVSHFLNLTIPCAEAQCVIHLLVCCSVSCLYQMPVERSRFVFEQPNVQFFSPQITYHP